MRLIRRSEFARFSCILLALPLLCASCSRAGRVEPADLILTKGRIYSLAWPAPGPDGAPAPGAPHDPSGWHPDAQAVAARAGKIVFVGSAGEAEKYAGPDTRRVDLQGATVIPGLIESHVHVVDLGRGLSRVELRGLDTEEAIVARVRAAAENTPKGQWIEGYGWDEGAWASRLPDMDLLSREVPDHPVYLRGLHGFSVWGNRLAFERAGINAHTVNPEGGEIRKDRRGNPTGILSNTAVRLLEAAIPPPTVEQIRGFILNGLDALAKAGYVCIHEAGADTDAMKAFEGLEAEGRLPLRVYAMLAARDEALMQAWLKKGPDRQSDRMLVTRAVKVFYDGALGSRGAFLLEDYSDQPGRRGVGGREYGFNPELMAEMMKAGFQLVVHAIGDAANRQTLDFFESVFRADPAAATNRNRIEHAQVLHLDDIPRFARLGIIASMQPPHAVEDMPWAEQRLGPQRVSYAYAWRSVASTGAHLAFNSDLPGSDYNIFYGLHSAITRRDKQGKPEAGWHAEQCVTPEQALRAYTQGGAYASFMENETATLAPGRWADMTVMDIDPLNTGEKDPERLLQGKILKTMVAAKY